MGSVRQKAKATRNARLQERSATCQERLAWNSEQLALIGTASDAAVARMLGVGPSSVEAKRRRLGIPPVGQPNSEKKNRFSSRQLALLGKLPDAEISGRMKISLDAVIVLHEKFSIAQESLIVARCRDGWQISMVRLRS